MRHTPHLRPLPAFDRFESPVAGDESSFTAPKEEVSDTSAWHAQLLAPWRRAEQRAGGGEGLLAQLFAGLEGGPRWENSSPWHGGCWETNFTFLLVVVWWEIPTSLLKFKMFAPLPTSTQVKGRGKVKWKSSRETTEKGSKGSFQFSFPEHREVNPFRGFGVQCSPACGLQVEQNHGWCLVS